MNLLLLFCGKLECHTSRSLQALCMTSPTSSTASRVGSRLCNGEPSSTVCICGERIKAIHVSGKLVGMHNKLIRNNTSEPILQTNGNLQQAAHDSRAIMQYSVRTGFRAACIPWWKAEPSHCLKITSMLCRRDGMCPTQSTYSPRQKTLPMRSLRAP